MVLSGVCLLVAPAVEGRTATSRAGRDVEVVAAGWSGSYVGYSIGVVLRNRLRTLDALHVTGTLKVKRPSGWETSGYLLVPVIPAGQTVYVASLTGVSGPLRISLDVGSERPMHYHLPPVSDIKIDRAKDEINATVTNPYNHPLSITSVNTEADAVIFDRKGIVIGGVGGGWCDLERRRGLKVINPRGRADVVCDIPNDV